MRTVFTKLQKKPSLAISKRVRNNHQTARRQFQQSNRITNCTTQAVNHWLAVATSARSFTSGKSNTMHRVTFTPSAQAHENLVLPISMSRYDAGKKNQEQYDKALRAVFTHTAELLEQGEVQSVDVISAAGLQAVNWDAEKVKKIENHFLETHAELLNRQTNCYVWNEWIDEYGRNQYERYYQEVVARSQPGSDWRELMESTYSSITLSSSLSASVEYQRREYAAIMLMECYNKILYLGRISPAWAYLYKIIQDISLPTFTRISVSNQTANVVPVQSADANHSVQLILSLLEKTLSSQNFPKKQKQEIIEGAVTLFNAYGPKSDVLIDNNVRNDDKIESKTKF